MNQEDFEREVRKDPEWVPLLSGEASKRIAGELFGRFLRWSGRNIKEFLVEQKNLAIHGQEWADRKKGRGR